MAKVMSGNYFEDFEIGQRLRHATPRTVTDGDVALYQALYGSRFAVTSGATFAAACGMDRMPLDSLLVFHVVFGKTGGGVDLSAIAAGSGGFVINGQCAGDQSGCSVSAARDVNGDGFADLIVGASSSDPAAGLSAGRSYVVFGKTGGGAVDLSAIAAGSGGFVINGQYGGDWSGGSVSAAGDVNGDGLADVLVGANWRCGADPGPQRPRFRRACGRRRPVGGCRRRWRLRG